MKTTLFGASVAAIMLATSAIAQTTAPSAPADRAPADRPSTMQPGSAAPSTNAPSTTAPRPSATAPSNTTAPRSSTAMNEWRASKLVGTAVYNQANERIGDINEILIDKSGKVASVVLGVGGFLGMGEHEVAVPFTDLQFQQDGNSMKVMSSYTKQSLTSMPQWRWDNSANAPATAPARR